MEPHANGLWGKIIGKCLFLRNSRKTTNLSKSGKRRKTLGPKNNIVFPWKRNDGKTWVCKRNPYQSTFDLSRNIRRTSHEMSGADLTKLDSMCNIFEMAQCMIQNKFVCPYCNFWRKASSFLDWSEIAIFVF